MEREIVPHIPEAKLPKKIPLPEQYVSNLVSRGLHEHAEVYKSVVTASSLIRQNGGRALLVGGAVRDMIAGHDSSKDFDIEVYGLYPEALEKIMSQFGTSSSVGKAYEVLKVRIGNIDLDLSYPRSDSKTGEGHRDFEVQINPFMSIEDAAKRRDFTMNSILADPLTGEVFDPYGGITDLENRLLRVTDEKTFTEDPLRALRAMQFIGRFDYLTLDPKSKEVIKDMAPSMVHLSTGRFLEEWRKLLTKSKKPSQGLELGMELGIFNVMHPEFIPLATTPQELEFHPEGDVWTHTKMAVDQAARIAKREGLDEDMRWTTILAALCHDLGKPNTTSVDQKGKIRAFGHEEAGVPIASSFMESIGVDKYTQEKVKALVDAHMWPHTSFERGDEVSDGAFRKLSTKLHPATFEELALLAESDYCGRGQFLSNGLLTLPNSFEEGDWLRRRADRLGVMKEKAINIISGKDLIALGFKQNAQFGELIRIANDIHNENGTSREELMETIVGKPLESAIESLQSMR